MHLAATAPPLFNPMEAVKVTTLLLHFGFILFQYILTMFCFAFH